MRSSRVLARWLSSRHLRAFESPHRALFRFMLYHDPINFAKLLDMSLRKILLTIVVADLVLATIAYFVVFYNTPGTYDVVTSPLSTTSALYPTSTATVGTAHHLPRKVRRSPSVRPPSQAVPSSATPRNRYTIRTMRSPIPSRGPKATPASRSWAHHYRAINSPSNLRSPWAMSNSASRSTFGCSPKNKERSPRQSRRNSPSPKAAHVKALPAQRIPTNKLFSPLIQPYHHSSSRPAALRIFSSKSQPQRMAVST